MQAIVERGATMSDAMIGEALATGRATGYNHHGQKIGSKGQKRATRYSAR